MDIASIKPSPRPRPRRSPALLASQSLPALKFPGFCRGGCFGCRERPSASAPTFLRDTPPHRGAPL